MEQSITNDQTHPVAKLPSELVVENLCFSDQTHPVAKLPSELVVENLCFSDHGNNNNNNNPIVREADSETNVESSATKVSEEDVVHDTEIFISDDSTNATPSFTPIFIPKQTNLTTKETYSDSKDILEVDMNIDDLPNNDTVYIKKRNDIYYQMYKEAKRKAKMARDLAISSYLEAKHIKNTYMLENEDSDSDFDEESFDNME
jgi:hypothetical protein